MASVRVARTEEVPVGTGKVVQAAGKAVALFNIGGTFYAVDNRCTHVGGPLGQGKVEGNVVTCPWHGSRFRLTDGSVCRGPATFPQPRLETRVRGGQVEVRGRQG